LGFFALFIGCPVNRLILKKHLLEGHYNILLKVFIFRNKISLMKGQLLLSFIIQPFPPKDFGQYVDYQSLPINIGIGKDTFLMYTNAIFNKGVQNNVSLPTAAGTHNHLY
jgi:hypothetical protein